MKRRHKFDLNYLKEVVLIIVVLAVFKSKRTLRVFPQ